jgi:hypothetical protein
VRRLCDFQGWCFWGLGVAEEEEETEGEREEVEELV